jgi:hypothetical protein
MWGNWGRALEAGIAAADAVPTPDYLTDTLQLFIHFLAWPLLFLVGLFRWNTVTPLTGPISQVTDRLRILPSGWPEVTTAMLLWLLAGIGVLLVRAFFGPRRPSVG